MTLDGVWWDLYVGLPFVAVVTAMLLLVRQQALTARRRHATTAKHRESYEAWCEAMWASWLAYSAQAGRPVRD